MASLTKRKVHGHVYYYLVESQRINGKPRLVMQKFLGRVDQVVARLAAEPPVPTQVTVGEYGGSMALLRIAERLHLVQHIDAAAPKRHQGPSVGAYLLVAAINRALAPPVKPKWPMGISGRLCIIDDRCGRPNSRVSASGIIWAMWMRPASIPLRRI